MRSWNSCLEIRLFRVHGRTHVHQYTHCWENSKPFGFIGWLVGEVGGIVAAVVSSSFIALLVPVPSGSRSSDVSVYTSLCSLRNCPPDPVADSCYKVWYSVSTLPEPCDSAYRPQGWWFFRAIVQDSFLDLPCSAEWLKALRTYIPQTIRVCHS